jgi:hypothetical protein
VTPGGAGAPSWWGYNQSVKDLLESLNNIGFERTRRAVAALALSLFVFLYLLVSVNPPSDEWRMAFLAMAACYGVAFMGVAAEWFWGRWFAVGLGWSGVMVGAASMVLIGWSPVLGIYGGVHGLVVLALAGKKMAERFDLQPAWRERYGMDEFGVARLRKTVTRASASLPSVILWALAPKEPGQGMIVAALALFSGLALVGGLRGVLRLRTWGMAALGAAALALAVGGAAGLAALGPPRELPGRLDVLVLASGHLPRALTGEASGLIALLGAAFVATALLPFVGPAARFLRARR